MGERGKEALHGRCAGVEAWPGWPQRERSDVAPGGYAFINSSSCVRAGASGALSGTWNSRRSSTGPTLVVTSAETSRSLGALASRVHASDRSRSCTCAPGMMLRISFTRDHWVAVAVGSRRVTTDRSFGLTTTLA